MTTTPILPGITSSFIDTPRRAHVRRCGRARSQVGRGRPGVRGAQIRHGRVRRGTGRVHAGSSGALQGAEASGVPGRPPDFSSGENLEARVEGEVREVVGLLVSLLAIQTRFLRETWFVWRVVGDMVHGRTRRR